MDQGTIKQIVEQHGTPSYIFDLTQLEQRVQMIQALLGEDVTLAYAMKANPFLVSAMKELIERFEVCSPGEFRICERNGIPMEQVVLSGVNKEKAEMKRVMDAYGGKGTFTIESFEHLKILQECAKEKGVSIHVIIRVSSGNQFGMDEEAIRQVAAEREKYPELMWEGLQFYSGTQKKKLSKLEKELRHLDEFCISLKQEYGFEVRELEYGPGLFVSYFQEEEKPDDKKMLEGLADILNSLKFGGHITLEMGRYMVAQCGYYATSIVDQKINKGQRYGIVDGGIHHLNYYGQRMAMKLPYFTHIAYHSGEEVENWTVCGSLCTAGDVLVKQLPLKNGNIRDILVFENAGAYSVTEGIYLFLSRDLPNVIFYSSSQGAYLVRGAKATDTINSAL